MWPFHSATFRSVAVEVDLKPTPDVLDEVVSVLPDTPVFVFGPVSVHSVDEGPDFFFHDSFLLSEIVDSVLPFLAFSDAVVLSAGVTGSIERGDFSEEGVFVGVPFDVDLDPVLVLSDSCDLSDDSLVGRDDPTPEVFESQAHLPVSPLLHCFDWPRHGHCVCIDGVGSVFAKG